MDNGKCYCILLAGGTGRRCQSDKAKQFLELGGRKIISWSLGLFCGLTEIHGIILVLPENCGDAERGEFRAIPKVIKIVSGGATRQESARNGLNAYGFSEEDILIFHDAARPFVTRKMILECVQAARDFGAAGVYLPAVDTIAVVESNFVQSIPERKNLYYTQTPQAFRCSVIRAAHEKAQDEGIIDSTDDANLALNAGFRVRAVMGRDENIKITTAFDLQLAELIAMKRVEERDR